MDTILKQVDLKITDSLKSKNESRTRALRLLKSDLANNQKLSTPLDEAVIVTSFAKRRTKTIDAYKKELANSPVDVVESIKVAIADEEFEITVAKEFMLENIVSTNNMTPEELETCVTDYISKNGITSIKDMGKAVKELKVLLEGKADAKSISDVLKVKLVK